MGGAPSIPQQNFGQELGQILQYLPKFVQKQYGLSRDYAPKFSQLDVDQINQFSPQYAQAGLDLTNKFGPQYAQAGLDITKEFAPQYAQAGLDISKTFAPQYLDLNLAQMQKNIASQPLLKELNAQAQTELANQGHLTDQEAYQATQGSITPFAGRNNVFNQAEAQSFLDRDSLVRQRRQEAQQFASNVQNLDIGQLGGIGGVVQAPNFAGYAQNPNLAAYAQAPNLAAYAAPGSGFGPMAAGLGATSGATNSLMNFGQNIFDANQNAAATASIAGANKGAGMLGAGIGAVGSIAGAAL